MKDKIVLIIPGFKNFPSLDVYKEIAELYAQKQITPLILDITWDGRLMSEYVGDILKEYQKHTEKDIFTFGFSFGAMAAFIASAQVSIVHQLLCSTSPYFSEDLSRIEKERKSWIKGVGKRRMSEFTSISRREVVKNVNAKTDLLVGTVEGDIMMDVSKAIYADLVSSKSLELIKGAGHDISNQKYYAVIKEKITVL